MSYSILQIFPGLEASIREYVPRCEFYFGEDEQNRHLQPPSIVWDVDGADPTTFERQSAVDGLVSPKPFSADAVQIVATVMGAAEPTAVDTEKTQRAQEFAATEHLAQSLRWALKKSSDAGALGKSDWLGYTVLQATTTERGSVWECRFSVNIQIVAPEPLISDPPHELTTDTITLEIP